MVGATFPTAPPVRIAKSRQFSIAQMHRVDEGATPKRLNSHDSTRSENETKESLTRSYCCAQLTNRGENVKENKQRKKEAKKENKKRKKLPYLTLLGKRARIKVR